jgi:hypothetical protein
MRAVSIERSAHALVEKNLAEHCDTGALVEGDASGTRIVDNWFHDCRIGVVCWNDRDTTIDANAISAPRDHAIVTNAPVEITNTNELGGDVWSAPA